MVYSDGVHLVADTLEELHAFAQTMELQREWFQDHPRHPHYDLTTRRAARRAFDNGAHKTTPEHILRIAHSLSDSL